MKAIELAQHGGPEVLVLRDAEKPQAAAGRVLVKLVVAGVNYIDTYQRSGLYPVKLPFIPGQEGAGVVEEVGEGVRGFRVGEQVAYTGVPFSYAEYVSAPADRLIKVPKKVGLETAAAVLLQGLTAHYLVNSTYPLKRGDLCLVHAAAGGVGQLLVQLAKRKGASVIATASTREKTELARRAGADHVIRYSDEDFVAEVRRLTGGRGVEVVYDSVGKATFEKSLDCLKPRGMMVSFGNSSGKVEGIEPVLLMRKGSLFLTRPTLDHYISDRASLEERAGEILRLVASGKLKVMIGARFRLGDAAQAHRDLEGRKTTGKVVLSID